MLIQMTGLSGAGKTTLAQLTAQALEGLGYIVAVLDGDAYRQTVCKYLGFSREDRLENIRRLGGIALAQQQQMDVVIIAAINPYEEGRHDLQQLVPGIKTIWVHCSYEVLCKRDPKGLYARAALPQNHPHKINNLTGVNDPFETPAHYNLKIDTTTEAIETSADQMLKFVLQHTDKIVNISKSL